VSGGVLRVLIFRRMGLWRPKAGQDPALPHGRSRPPACHLRGRSRRAREHGGQDLRRGAQA